MRTRMPRLLAPIHPGEIIREEVLVPLDLGVNQLAKLLAIDTARLNEIVRRSEEHTSELQSLRNLVCRLPLEKRPSQQRQAGARPVAAPVRVHARHRYIR